MPEPATVKDKGEHAAQSLENELGKPNERDLSAAIDEIKEARGNPVFMAAFNAKLSDNEHMVPMLSGFKLIGVDAENEMVFEDGERHRYELDAQGKRVDIWGAPDNNREFIINPDGSAKHTVKKGDHIWGITKDMLWEKLGHEPDNKQVADAVNEVIAYNKEKGNITDPNHIEPGNTIEMPPSQVKEVKQKRHEGWAVNTDGTTDVTLPDGRSRSIERDQEGHVNKVVEKDADGNPVATWTPGADGTWVVTSADGTVVRTMKCSVEADQEGNIKITHTVSGAVEEFRGNGEHVITTKEGTVYEERPDGWYRKDKDKPEATKVEGGIKIDIDGNVVENPDAATPPPAPPPPESGAGAGGTDAAAGAASASGEAKAFALAPNNKIYHPVAPPGLCEGGADGAITSHTAGPDGGDFDVESRTVTEISVEQARAEKLIPADVQVPPGGKIRIYKGQLDGVGYLDPKFDAIQVTDAQGNIVYNRVAYEGKNTMWIQADNNPGSSVYGQVVSSKPATIRTKVSTQPPSPAVGTRPS